MKETEVRERIEVFLKSTVRKAVIPASLGVGLALAGCERTSKVPVYSAPMREDAAISARDAADAARVPEYAGPFPRDTNDDRFSMVDSADGRMILDGAVPEYAAPMKLDTREYRPDVPVYAAPMIDAADALDAERG